MWRSSKGTDTSTEYIHEQLILVVGELQEESVIREYGARRDLILILLSVVESNIPTILRTLICHHLEVHILADNLPRNLSVWLDGMKGGPFREIFSLSAVVNSPVSPVCLNSVDFMESHRLTLLPTIRRI